MTDKQRELARHALGLPNKKRMSYRNHFCIGPGGDGYEDWESLVAAGLAIKRSGPHWGGDSMFFLTLAGALEAREPNEHISREDAAEMRRMEASDATTKGLTPATRKRGRPVGRTAKPNGPEAPLLENAATREGL